MDLACLRRVLEGPLVGLNTQYSHKHIDRALHDLGVEPAGGGARSERWQAAFDAIADERLPDVAQRYLDLYCRTASQRFAIEEVLWADWTGPAIPVRFRRELARQLNPEDLYLDTKRFNDLLERLWVRQTSFDSALDAFAFLGVQVASTPMDKRSNLERQRAGHADWTVDGLFDELGAYSCCDRRFCLFLEGLVCHVVRPDVASLRTVAAKMNTVLRGGGAELREIGEVGGYPLFSVVSLGRGVGGAPKNLIFASQCKPDIRVSDAINNDIRLVGNERNDWLVYDRPIPSDGLHWSHLQDWWSSATGEGGEKAKRSLYRRLLACLPETSPPQRFFFEQYYLIHAARMPAFPALLPEVWLHWDHKTVAQRGADALLHFRMDFLLIISQSVRVVLEVDGKTRL